MKNLKNIAKGFIVFSFLGLLAVAGPAKADNNNGNAYMNARSSLKADALVNLESATGVVLGPNGALRVLGAKVVSVTESVVKATASFGSSVLNFVVNVDSDTKVNGSSDAKVSDLKAGDKISFAGDIDSSSSSSIVVNADHIVSQALIGGTVESKTFWRGEIKSIDEGDKVISIELPGGRDINVAVSSSTVILLDGSASSLASLDEGDKVSISGNLNADGSVVSATKITADSDKDSDNDDVNGKPRKDDKPSNNGWLGKIRHWFWFK
ncbi:MAG: DUF5666 domain-containing protein [Candidatus Paceibacterota bacterium]|jgi:hypothetical protein